MLVLIAPALGAVTAAVATWQAVLAGSILYMPLGLVLVLAVIAIVQSHKPLDFVLFGLLLVGVIAWFRTDPLRQAGWLESLQEWASLLHLVPGLLLILGLLLIWLYSTGLTRWLPPRSRSTSPQSG